MKNRKKSAADQLDEEAKRRALNRLASRQAISESQAQPEFHANHECLKAERLGRESQPNGTGMSNLGMQQPAPELPDDTPLAEVELPVRIRNALSAAGLKTVGQVRETSDETLLSVPDLGKTSVAHLRERLGLPSCDGVRPPDKKPS